MPAECHSVAASAAAGPVVPPDRCCLRLAAWLAEVRSATAVRRAGHFLAAPEWGGLCFLRVRKPGHRAAPLVPSSRRSAAVQLAVAPEWGRLSIGITVTALFRAAARARFRPCRG